MTAEPASMPSTPTSETSRDLAIRNQVPPQDLEAEQSLLGSMMLSRDAIGDVLPIIHRAEGDRFYRPDHRQIFEVLVDMYDQGDAIDLVTVRNELDRRDLLKEVGGVDYIVQLAESVPSHLHAEHYAKLVRDKGMLRDLIEAVGKIHTEAHKHHEGAREILDRAEQLLFEVTDQRITEQAEPIREYLDEIFTQIVDRDAGYLTGVPTGFIELDDMLSGMQRGEMLIVAARPSMGKTAFGLNMAEYLTTREKRPAVFFSMEMSKQAIVQRIMCSRGRIDSHKLRRGMLTDQDKHQLAEVCDELNNATLFVDDTPGMSVLELRAKARRLRMRHKVEAVFVDYLQLMNDPAHKESRQQEVSAISRGLKALARELNIPVVVLAQLNRNPEGRTGNRPRMSDLRESGAIEQDADVIMLLHREEYYEKENPSEDIQGVAEVIVDKQRNGPTGIIKVHFNKRYTRFDNLNLSGEPAYIPGGVEEMPVQYGREPEPPVFDPDGPGAPAARDDSEDAPF